MAEPKKKRRRLIEEDLAAQDALPPRCTSPSHLLVQDRLLKEGTEEAQRNFGSERFRSVSHHKALIERRKIDNVLDAVSTLYYHPTHVCRPLPTQSRDLVDFLQETAQKGMESTIPRITYSAGDALLSPYFQPSVLDAWTPKEIMLFEAGITCCGKDFHAIQKLIPTKTCRDLLHFFYFWKQSSHYAMWKHWKKPMRALPNGKQEQWTLVAKQLEQAPFTEKSAKGSKQSKNQKSK